MLKIKDDKWAEFEEKRKALGFKHNGDKKSSYVKDFYQDESKRTYIQIRIEKSTKTIHFETVHECKAGISTTGKELDPIYDLIMTDFIEKV